MRGTAKIWEKTLMDRSKNKMAPELDHCSCGPAFMSIKGT